MIYFAPLQGFTDYVYRKSYAKIFTGIDAFFVPYLSFKGGVIKPGHIREIEPGNNPQSRVVPQVLIKDSKELKLAVQLIESKGYTEVNLNLGCPYPMVTNRGKGSGLLIHPDKVDTILSEYYKYNGLDLSVKLRAGLNSSEEIKDIIKVLNCYPLKEVVLHPRTATQLYRGEIIDSAYQYASEMSINNLVFNGDISSVCEFEMRKEQFPQSKTWMIGRGILMNPFLPSEIAGISFSSEERKKKLMDFHYLIFDSYMNEMDNEGNALNKLKQFWFYFSVCFKNTPKSFKMIKKTKDIAKYKSLIASLFADFA